MFWMQRLKQEEPDALWAISYSDLMSLLLAVFVMIASMSELRRGARFDRVRDAVRGALGFGAISEPRIPVRRVPTLAERLEQAGLVAPVGPPTSSAIEAVRCCEMVRDADRLVIQVAPEATFEAGSATLMPAGAAAVENLAPFLRRGETRIEIRGFGDGGPDDRSLDLSYQRARSVVKILMSSGVEARRICATACGDQDPMIVRQSGGALPVANRRIDIVVHAAPRPEGNDSFAEKGQQDAR